MVGIYYTEDLMQKWFLRNLPIAREVLRNFKSLNALLDGFRDYETKRYRDLRNAIMFLCLPKVEGGLDRRSITRLAELEKTIDLFGVMDWNIKKLADFKSKLASEDPIQSLSVVTELMVASKMVERLNRDNVGLYPKLTTGGFSDIVVEVSSKSVFLEIGNLGKSLPERKIQEILNASAEHLGEKTTKICYLHLRVDTAELVVDDKGRIVVEDSIKKLNSEIDMLKLHELAGFKGHFNFDDIALIVTYQTQFKDMEQLLTPWDQSLLKLFNNDRIRGWLSCFDTNLLKKAKFIKGIMAGSEIKTLLVEIHTEDFYPSKAAVSERESFLNHVVRNVEGQIEEGQLQPNAPNIVLIQGDNWTMFGFDWISLEPLCKRLMRFFNERKEAYLSGVAFFGRDINKAVFVANRHSIESSQLSREDVTNLGFRWLEL